MTMIIMGFSQLKKMNNNHSNIVFLVAGEYVYSTVLSIQIFNNWFMVVDISWSYGAGWWRKKIIWLKLLEFIGHGVK